MPKISEEIDLTTEESRTMLKIIEKENITIHKFINRAVRYYIDLKEETLENKPEEIRNYTNIWK